MEALLFAHGGGFHGWVVDAETTVFSGLLRMVKTMLAAAPFLLSGVVAAGILRGMVGTERIRGLLGVGRWTGPIRGYLLGCLLPVCSLGALPVARELKRAGVSSGTILSFVLVAPVLNPISIVYGLSHIHPLILLYFLAGTFLVSLGVGWSWDYYVGRFRDRAMPQESLPQTPSRRFLLAGVTASQGVAGPEAIDYLLAVLAMGILGALLPYGVLQKGLTPDNPWAPVVMSLVAIPVYVTPFDVMMHFQLVVRDGYSMGAAFALMMLGAGANVGVANWLRRDFGIKPALGFLTVLFLATLAIGMLADRTIVQANASIADHTHAFDGFTRVHHVPANQSGLSWIYDLVVRDLRPPEIAGMALLAILAFSGLFVTVIERSIPLLEFIHRVPARTTMSRWNKPLPGWALGGVAVAGSGAILVALVFVFYPPADEILDDAGGVRVDLYDAIRKQDAEEIIRLGFLWEDLVRKIPTAVRIRRGALDEEIHAQVDEMLHALDLLHEFAEEEAYVKAKALTLYLERTHRSCRRAIQSPSSGGS